MLLPFFFFAAICIKLFLFSLQRVPENCMIALSEYVLEWKIICVDAHNNEKCIILFFSHSFVGIAYFVVVASVLCYVSSQYAKSTESGKKKLVFFSSIEVYNEMTDDS